MQSILTTRPFALVVSIFCFGSPRADSELRSLYARSDAVTGDVGLETRQLSLSSKPGNKWCQVWCPQSPIVPPVRNIALPLQSADVAGSVTDSNDHCDCRRHEAATVDTTISSVDGVKGRNTDVRTEETRAQQMTERIVSAMTLGAVAFQMSLFYIINHRDPDIKRYALSVIGQTISIFCAVLTFSTIWGVMEEHLEALGIPQQGIVCCTFPCMFFVVMQVIVALSARVRGEEAGKLVTVKFTRTHIFDLEIPAHVLNAKMFGTGAAQMCAAATIRSVGHIQMLLIQKEHSVYMVLAMCPISFWALFSIAWTCGWFRRKIILWDGIIDDAEKVWIEVAEQCEDEVIALSCGFYSAVGARLLITDSLPYVLLRGFAHRRSLEVSDMQHSFFLWLVGVACAVSCILLNVAAYGQLKKGINMRKLRSDSLGRVLRVFTLSVGMTFAWCTCFGTHLFALQLSIAKEGVQLRLIIALFQSFACFIVIICLDFIADRKCAGPAFDHSLIMIICALGAAVGLSWEEAFHQCATVSVQFMAEDRTVFRASDDPKVWAICLAATIVCAVLPAYRFYIVPRMYQMLEEHEADLLQRELQYTTQHGSGHQLGESMFMWTEGPENAEEQEEEIMSARSHSRA